MTDQDLLSHHDRMLRCFEWLTPENFRAWWDGPDAGLLWWAELLRYAQDRHLSVLAPEDLLPLLAHGDSGVRTAALRVIGRIERRDCGWTIAPT